MTVALHRPRTTRLLLTGAATALALGLGTGALVVLGAGPSFFLFALAAVGLVDLVTLARRPLPPSGAGDRGAEQCLVDAGPRHARRRSRVRQLP